MMKLFTICILILCAGLAQLPLSAAESPSTNDNHKASYIIGYNLGASLARDGVQVDIKALLEGLNTGQAKKSPKYSIEEMKNVVTSVRSGVLETRKKNQQEFLKQNKQRPGVVVTSTGLQYEVINVGEGKSPIQTDVVTVHYRGWLIDSREFDNSHKRGKPATVTVTSVLPGWNEALKMMKPGGKWRIVLPSELGYGANGATPRVPPHATLIFEVELIRVGL
jgi:FKBP-type peptidyl-prolyl cis-trans isomerase FklB